MPTLGFLKKIRTKESAGPNSPKSPTTENPLTSTRSAGQDSLQPTISQPTTASSTTTAVPTSAANEPSTTGSKVPMNQDVTHTQQYGAVDQQNLPSISNLINPPQSDGSTQSYNTASVNNANMASNGAQAVPAQQTPSQPTVRATKGKYTLTDFEIQRTLGTGSFGRVHLVQSKHNQRFYAVKVLKKQQVVKMKQVEHTNDERKMLQEVKHPFLITLWGTFQDSRNLYMVMDFVEGGELFSLLRKSQVSFRQPKQSSNMLTYDNSVSRTLSPNSTQLK